MAKKKKVAAAKPTSPAASTVVERKTSAAKPPRPRKEAPPRPDAPKFEISEQTWRYSAIGISVLGAILRFAFLAIKPFHHDEGVNGFFLTGLVKDGNYHYDPANY